jgi:hypothetical protein
MRRPDIAITSRMSRGMRVRSSDGVFLGRVAEVWCGTDPKGGTGECDHSACSRIEVHPAAAGLLQRLARRRRPAGTALYVPCDVIAGVSGKSVELSVGARVVTKRWTGEPKWIRKARARLGPSASAGQGAYDRYEVDLWGGLGS